MDDKTPAARSAAVDADALAGTLARVCDAVMAHAAAPEVRRNRLALLAWMHGAMNRVADLSRLAA